MVGLAVFSFLKITDDSLDWIPTALLFIFTFTGTLGVLTLSFSMLAEVFPQKSRSLAVGISMSYCFGFSFFTIKYFNAMFETFGSGWVFTFYAAISLIGMLFSLFILPETNGKTLQEIENYFKK
jgi:MFS family permease